MRQHFGCRMRRSLWQQRHLVRQVRTQICARDLDHLVRIDDNEDMSMKGKADGSEEHVLVEDRL